MKLVGNTFTTNNYGKLLIIGYENNTKVRVKFLDTGYETVATLQNISNGEVKDKLLPTVEGVGVVGDSTVNFAGCLLLEYKIWREMLKRCYNVSFQVKHPSYKGCKVSENFKHFPYFKEWCTRQVGFGRKGWELDKDIIVKGNRVYSEDTCCFVPRHVNSIVKMSNVNKGAYPSGTCFHKASGKFTAKVNLCGKRQHLGLFDTPEEAFLAYKTAKEAYIKEVANKWKDQIDPRAYKALMNYEILS